MQLLFMMSKVKTSKTSKLRSAFQDFLMKIESSRLVANFQGISRLRSAFIFLR